MRLSASRQGRAERAKSGCSPRQMKPARPCTIPSAAKPQAEIERPLLWGQGGEDPRRRDGNRGEASAVKTGTLEAMRRIEEVDK